MMKKGIIILFAFIFLSSLVLAQYGVSNPNLPSLNPKTPIITASSGGNVTSITGDNCILVSNPTGDVTLTFNVSCAGNGTSTGLVDSVTSDSDYILINPTTGDVVINFNDTLLNATILNIASAFNDTSLILSINTTANIQALGFYNTSEVDALILSAGNSSFNQSLTDTLYYSIDNPLNFINQTQADLLYYSITNPLNFINITDAQVFNDTTLILAVNTSLWDYIETNEADWLSTFNATYAMFAYNQTTPAIDYADDTFIPLDEEGNLNVNSSDYWDNANQTNGTQFNLVTGILNIDSSWLEPFILGVIDGINLTLHNLTLTGDLFVGDDLFVTDSATINALLVGSGGNLASISSGGILTFAGTGAYRVATDACAFQSAAATTACLAFESIGGFGYAFRDVGANDLMKVFLALGTNDGGTWSRDGFSTSATTVTLTSSQNNYAGFDNTGMGRVNATTAISITGIRAPASPHYKEMKIFNFGANDVTFTHESGSSTAGNRFTSVTGANIVISTNEGIGMQYDRDTARWRAWEL